MVSEDKLIEENTLERKMLYITFSIMCACMVQEGQLNFRQEICTLQWKKGYLYISGMSKSSGDYRNWWCSILSHFHENDRFRLNKHILDSFKWGIIKKSWLAIMIVFPHHRACQEKVGGGIKRILWWEHNLLKLLIAEE